MPTIPDNNPIAAPKKVLLSTLFCACEAFFFKLFFIKKSCKNIKIAEITKENPNNAMKTAVFIANKPPKNAIGTLATQSGKMRLKKSDDHSPSRQNQKQLAAVTTKLQSSATVRSSDISTLANTKTAM